MEREELGSWLIRLLAVVVVVSGLSGARLAGVPVSAGLLGLLLIATVAWRRQAMASLSWLQVAFLSALCLGLISLSSQHLPGGIREVVQCVLVFGVAWVLFASTDESARRWLAALLGAACVLFMVWGAAARFAGAPQPLSDARLALIAVLTFPFLIHKLRNVAWWWLGAPLGCALLGFAVSNGGLLICGVVGALVTLLLGARRRAVVLMPICAALFVVAAVAAGGSAWETLAPRHPESGNLKRLFIEYEATPGAVAAAPFTGHGLGDYKNAIRGHFRRFADPDDNTIAPDTNSAYALTAVEAGLPAALLMAVLVGGVALRALTQAGKDTNAAPCAGAAVALVLCGLFAVLVTRNTGMLVACVLGLASARPARKVVGRMLWPYKLGMVGAAALACIAAGRADMAGRDKPRLEIIDGAVGASDASYWVYEAEEPRREPDGTMTIGQANDASNNMVLSIPEGAGKGQGAAVYAFRELPPGAYSVWVRAWWTDGCANSIGCVVREVHAVISDEIFQRWHWVRAPRRFDLDENVELRLQNLEAGIMIDQILLTTDARFVPHGKIMPEKPGN